MKLPKFYNPFKAHIVQFSNGKFAVRKWRYLWVYKETTTFFDIDEIHWWKWPENVQKWCMINTLDEAKALRDKVHVKDESTKVQVIHG